MLNAPLLMQILSISSNNASRKALKANNDDEDDLIERAHVTPKTRMSGHLAPIIKK